MFFLLFLVTIFCIFIIIFMFFIIIFFYLLFFIFFIISNIIISIIIHYYIDFAISFFLKVFSFLSLLSYTANSLHELMLFYSFKVILITDQFFHAGPLHLFYLNVSLFLFFIFGPRHLSIDNVGFIQITILDKGEKSSMPRVAEKHATIRLTEHAAQTGIKPFNSPLTKLDVIIIIPASQNHN